MDINLNKQCIKSVRLFCLFLTVGLKTFSLEAFFLTGSGHYSVRGEMRSAPGMAGDRGTHQAIEQSFRLLGEARFNERSSFFLELAPRPVIL